MRDFAEVWQAADKIVYSRTLEAVSTRKTQIERNFDPEAIRRLKESVEQDIHIGGAELAAHAFRSGLIDECHLFLIPIIVGGGKQASQTTFDWSSSFWRNAALAVAWFSSVIEQGKEEPPNTACTRLVGVCARFQAVCVA